MRTRREPLISVGSRRSSGVIEQMIASIRSISRSSISALLDLLGHARQHPEHVLERAHLAAPGCIWSRKSSSVNWPLRSFCSALLRLVLVEGGLGLLDEREHVAHAEDAARHAVGVERLELVELLAGTGEQDRLADDLLHRQRGTTARVAVDLGEDHAVEADRLVERGRRRSPLPDRSSRRRRAACRAAARRRGPARSSSMSSASICSRPAVSTMTTLRPRRAASSMRAARRPRPGRSARSRTGTSTRSPSTRSCSTAAGRWRSAPTSSGCRPWLFSSRASLAAAVVFPEPCRPASITTRRRLRAHRELAGGAAERLRRAPRARS